MLLHRIVAPRRHTPVLGALMLAASLSAASRDAHACGPTLAEIQALLPLDGATDVPLNAVLISSSNVTEAVFELHQVLDDANDADRAIGAPPADAGVNPASDAGPSGAVPLSVDCDARGQGGGAVCLARPLEPLKPNTRYAWHANVAVPEGYVQDDFEGLSREFTTGSAIDEQPIAADALSLVMTDYHQDPNSAQNECGIDHWMDVAYSLGASEPGVLHFADYTPSYVMHATLIAGGSGATAATATLYSPPACIAPVIYDVAGQRTALPDWCPRNGISSPPPAAPSFPLVPDEGTPRRPSPSAAPAVAARPERSLCTLSMPPSSTSRVLPAAAALGLALLLVERRRRS
jgi:hypothetical protein